MTHHPYSLGCPVWACDSWRGGLYTEKAKRESWLSQYSAVFQAVEGNSTFYALPQIETVDRWAAATRDGFEFCLKVPRAITHDRMLVGADQETLAFHRILGRLAEANRLGPSFLQLPPNFDARGFETLREYISRWPSEFPLAVEVRHSDWFDHVPARGPSKQFAEREPRGSERGQDVDAAATPSNEARLNSLLEAHGCDRALFHSRALFSAPAETECEKVSQSRKPNSPPRTTVTGKRPFVRFIGRDRVDQLDPWIERWADIVAGWIQRGLQPLMFTHAPDDTFAPAFARRFHEALSARIPQQVDALPPFPGETEVRPPEQLSLF